MKKWICNVCGYIHEGEDPPRTCPLCSAPAAEFSPVNEEASKTAKTKTTAVPSGDTGDSQVLPGFVKNNRLLKFLAGHFPLFQFHPITAHFPNGLIPVSVFFLVLAILFDPSCVEMTAFYLLCAATVVAPFTVITGIYNWKTRYKGAVTSKFMFKLYGGIIFTILGVITIGWRLVNPEVVETTAGLYLLVNLALLGLVGALGHIGGGLVFAGKK